MLGAILGDIAGSLHEHRPHKSKQFELLPEHGRFTDDSVLTIATADALLNDVPFDRAYRAYYARYPHAGFGGMFHRWARHPEAKAYQSWGNGSAMRVAPVAYAAESIDQVLQMAHDSAAVTHDHPEGIRGAQAVALAVFLGIEGASKGEIRSALERRLGYDLQRRLDEIRPEYRFDVSCQGSVPESVIAFLESNSVEDAIRNAVSLGGDADTMACIAGAIAEAYYGPLDDSLARKVLGKLDDPLARVSRRFIKEFAHRRHAVTRVQGVNSVESAAAGALLGALVGDAVGGTLEFRWPYDHRLVDQAMELQGGGVYRLAPGQITDDGELTLSLANSITEANGYDQEAAARSYRAWFQSHPFDMGNTTERAFGEAAGEGASQAAVMLERTARLNADSKANGALMRIVPLAIWAARFDDDARVAEYAMQDARLSHGSLACQHANAAYSIAVASLVRQPGDIPRALSRTLEWLRRYGSQEVLDWFQTGQSGQLCPVHPQIGFVKIAFIHAIHHLAQRTPFVDAIRETVSLGGDADTNACIVGGLVGAAQGVEQIPESMRERVMQCDQTLGHQRPRELHPENALGLVTRLLQR